MKVRFVDLQAEHEETGAETLDAIREVIASGSFVLGPAVEDFETEFAAACGARHAIGVSSGSAALSLTLEAMGVGPGAEVVVPVNTFAATALAVTAVGARPVFADCDPRTQLLDPDCAARAISPRTRAIVPVHLTGRLVDLAPLERLGVPIVEDAAQAHGAARGGVRAGARGLAGCFSFYPSKNLGAYGDAGAVVTSDDALAARLRRLRNYGQGERYVHEVRGHNARLDALQAAVLRVKLRRLEAWNARRREAAAFYDRRLRAGIPRPDVGSGADGVFHLYVVRVGHRDALRGALAEAGIETGIHYPIPLHLQPCFRELGHRAGDFPHAERLAREILSLPLYPQIREDQLAHVVEHVNRLAEAP